MKRIGAVFAAFLLFSAASPAQTLPELFQKAKAQVKGESWAEALKTLEKLDAEAALPGNESARLQLAAPIAFYHGIGDRLRPGPHVATLRRWPNPPTPPRRPPA